MAGKGGGAWKVAYADFITAMMAFFLVMWLCAQDQKIRQAVAYFFMDPMGTSKKPEKSGSVAEQQSNGSVPQSESVALGKGRKTFTPPDQPSPSTKTVHDWIHSNEETTVYWKQQAQKRREAATRSAEVRNKTSTLDEVAAKELAKQMQQEMKQKIPADLKGVHQDLLFHAFAEVNWTEIAEEIIADLSKK
jgi:chemotaxis protein MotB